MKYPIMRGNTVNRLTVPTPLGGVNYADKANAIEDNQLTDAMNVWVCKGGLQTRPELEPKNEILKLSNNAPCEYKYVHAIINGIKTRCCLIKCIYGYDDNIRKDASVSIMIPGPEEDKIIDIYKYVGQSYANINYTAFVGAKNKGCGIYVLVNVKELNIGTGAFYTSERHIYEINSDCSGVEEFDISELYKPIVFACGKGNKYSSLPADENTVYAPSANFEGLNLLPGGYRCYFDSDGYSDCFSAPYAVVLSAEQTNSLEKNNGQDATVTVEGIDGFTSGAGVSNSRISFTFNKFGKSAQVWKYSGKARTEKENGFTINEYIGNVSCYLIKTPSGFKISFQFSGTVDGTQMNDISFALPSGDQLSNNIIFEGYASAVLSSESDTIFNMRFSTDFGGSDGIYANGTRVFLSGNSDKPAFVQWSDLNRPLYFSENCNAYVGNTADAVTGFAKQGENLIVFKKNSVYCSEYVQGSSYTADDVLNGNVIDVTTLSAVFPFYCINDSIGCDLPNTVVLCLNRLIWASTTGKVYTLVFTSNTNQKNIYPVSRNIEPEIIKTDMSGAFALEWQGHYMLFCKDKEKSHISEVFLLDYNRNAFRYVSSYSKSTGSAYRSFLWWRWRLNYTWPTRHVKISPIFGYAFENTCRLYGYDSVNESGSVSAYGYELSIDTIANVESYIETKQYDFSVANRKKKISNVALCFGNQMQTTVSAEFISDIGRTFSRPFSIRQNASNGILSGELHEIKPHISGCRTFGLKIQSDSGFALDSIDIYFSVIGGYK